jgi:hypothetical protein
MEAIIAIGIFLVGPITKKKRMVVVVFEHCISNRSVEHDRCVKNGDGEPLLTMKEAMDNVFINEPFASRYKYKFAYKDDEDLQRVLCEFGERLPEDAFMLMIGTYLDGAFAIGWVDRSCYILEAFEHYPHIALMENLDQYESEEDRLYWKESTAWRRLFLTEVIEPLRARTFTKDEIIPWMLRHGFRIDWDFSRRRTSRMKKLQEQQPF